MPVSRWEMCGRDCDGGTGPLGASWPGCPFESAALTPGREGWMVLSGGEAGQCLATSRGVARGARQETEVRKCILFRRPGLPRGPCGLDSPFPAGQDSRARPWDKDRCGAADVHRRLASGTALRGKGRAKDGRPGRAAWGRPTGRWWRPGQRQARLPRCCWGSEASSGREVFPSLQSWPLSFLPEVGAPTEHPHLRKHKHSPLSPSASGRPVTGTLLPLGSMGPQGQLWLPIATATPEASSCWSPAPCFYLPLTAAPWGPFSVFWKNPGHPG